MEEMHYFKESQREEIPVPDFKDNITRKLLLQFLCDLCTWAQATPVTSVGIKAIPHKSHNPHYTTGAKETLNKSSAAGKRIFFAIHAECLAAFFMEFKPVPL